jgi:hypothetical protein
MDDFTMFLDELERCKAEFKRLQTELNSIAADGTDGTVLHTLARRMNYISARLEAVTHAMAKGRLAEHIKG